MKNDMISRQKLLEELNGLKPEGFGESIAGMVAIHKIQEAPSVDVAPVVRGRWEPELMPAGVEYTGYEEMTVQALRCSECGIFIDVSEGHFSFCPYCGAKMDGGNDGQEKA